MNFTLTLFTSLQNKITEHIARQFTPLHYTSHRFTYLHSTPTWIPLLVTTLFDYPDTLFDYPNTLFDYPDWGFFPCFFLNCKANARVELFQISCYCAVLSLFVLFCCYCVVLFLFVLFCYYEGWLISKVSYREVSLVVGRTKRLRMRSVVDTV